MTKHCIKSGNIAMKKISIVSDFTKFKSSGKTDTYYDTVIPLHRYL